MRSVSRSDSVDSHDSSGHPTLVKIHRTIRNNSNKNNDHVTAERLLFRRIENTRYDEWRGIFRRNSNETLPLLVWVSVTTIITTFSILKLPFFGYLHEKIPVPVTIRRYWPDYNTIRPQPSSFVNKSSPFQRQSRRYVL